MTPDPQLRRVEHRAITFTLAAAVLARLVPGGNWSLSSAVACGGLLIGVSYWIVRRTVTGVAERAVDTGRTNSGWRGVVLVPLRYALLAGMAYVMIARLRLPPIGLLIGASAIPVAVAFEIVRRPGRP